MSENLFKKRKYEFVETIMKLKRLPKVWEFHFTDGTDQRLWFNKIYKLDVYRKMLSEVDLLLKQYNIKILNDTEKEEAEKKAAEEAEALRKARLASLEGISEEALGSLANELGINPAECKDQKDVLRKVKAALKK